MDGMREKLQEAIQPYRPAIVESYKKLVTSQFEQMVKQLGPALKNAYNDWTWAISMNQQIAPNLKNLDQAQLRELGINQREAPREIDPAKLKKNAEKYADEALGAWFNKIVSKVGDLDNLRFSYSPQGFSFTMYGKKNGKDVQIKQEMIINVSKKHLLFNQFPSRIYVDGKFMSEAKYKELFVK